MPNPTTRPSIDQTIDSLIELAGCSVEHRILLAGTTSPDSIPDWRSRGYHRVATTATSKLPRGQYDAAFVEWRQHSIKALETMLDWLVEFLSPQGVLVISIDRASDTAPARRKLRSTIERLGFRAETGRRCESGLRFRRAGSGTSPSVVPGTASEISAQSKCVPFAQALRAERQPMGSGRKVEQGTNWHLSAVAGSSGPVNDLRDRAHRSTGRPHVTQTHFKP
jgi:hypothetical protein